MSCYRTKVPKITFGVLTQTQYTVNIAYPIDNWIVSSRAFGESTFLQIESGEEDAWIINTEYYLEADIRFIPADNTTSPLATGWDGTTGFNAFLVYCRNEKSPFRWYPDKDDSTYIESYLVEPTTTAPTINGDGTRTIRLYIRNATTPYDGY